MRSDTGGASDSLLDRARSGDARAFEQLALEVERPLFRHAARMLGQDDAEDCVQDALLSAWKSMGSFEGTSFRAWVFRIVTNRALDRLRSLKRHPELPLDPPLENDDSVRWAEPAAPGPELADLAADREALRVVEDALATIPAEQRAVLLLRDVEGFAYEEIAAITSTEIGTVKSRIHRGRLAVRNILVSRGWKGSAG
jgi:RNA polymerase sigma-70 factor (ECF subfamily)